MTVAARQMHEVSVPQKRAFQLESASHALIGKYCIPVGFFPLPVHRNDGMS